MRILLCSHEMTYTGAPRSLLNMAIVLKRLKHQIVVWSLKKGEFTKEFIHNGIDVKNVGSKWSAEEIKKFDIVIANTIFCILFAEFAQKYANTVLFLREAHNIPELLTALGVEKECLENIENIACVSEYAEKFIRENYCLKRIYTLHNYVKDNYQKQLNIVRGKTIHFAIIGTVEPRKQQGVVIQAFEEMPLELRKRCILHLIGKCPEWSRYYWSSFPVLAERILYHGEIVDEKERLKLYKKMNVFIVASRDEACSLVALEGAMLGKALILSDHVGAGYLSRDKKYVFNVDDVEQLIRQMSCLVSRRELLMEGIRMRNSYKSMASVDNYQKELVDFLKWIRKKLS